MSSDVAMFDDDLKGLEDQIRACLRKMESQTGDARQSTYNRASDLMKTATKSVHHLKVEIRSLDDAEAVVYEAKCTAHNQTINQLKDELASRRFESTPSAGNGGGGAAGGDYGAADDGKGAARQTKDRIVKTQDEAKKALERIERTTEDTKQTAEGTAQKLAEQTDQIKRMNEKLNKLDSEVDRAKSELHAFIRRMMTDKIILCFILLVIIAVIVIVVIKTQDHGASNPFGSPPATPAPPTPVPLPPPPTPSAVKTAIKMVLRKAAP